MQFALIFEHIYHVYIEGYQSTEVLQEPVRLFKNIYYWFLGLTNKSL
jgi:hypothetical protein